MLNEGGPYISVNPGGTAEVIRCFCPDVFRDKGIFLWKGDGYMVSDWRKIDSERKKTDHNKKKMRRKKK